MARFHPEDELLLEYSAGRSDWALSICIAGHLHFCAQCRDRVNKFDEIGGHCLTQAKTVAVADTVFSATLARIKAGSATAPTVGEQACKAKSADFAQLPPVVQKLASASGKLRWSYVTPSLKAAHLTTGQDQYEVCFHKMKKGGWIAEHDHKGRELTLVLEGCFSDEKGTYTVGDFIVKQPGEKHRPTATRDQDCLCLSIAEAPVKLTGAFRMLNPFLRVRPG